MTRLLLSSRSDRSALAALATFGTFRTFGVIAALAALAVSPRTAQATERRFTYTYESGVLRPGDKEIEPWTTIRKDKIGFYNRLDQRLEFEVGLGGGLQTAWYLNFTGVAENAGGQRR